jgi:RNase H
LNNVQIWSFILTVPYLEAKKVRTFYSSTFTKGFRLNGMSSVFTSELFAIRDALKAMLKRPCGKVLICSDSQSALQAILLMYSNHYIVLDIHFYLNQIVCKGFNVVFCWVPGHVGIVGNELADQEAKSASHYATLDFDSVPSTDIKKEYKKHLVGMRQAAWTALQGNKLRRIMSTLPLSQNLLTPRLTRRKEVMLSRLHIGHTHMTHSFLLTPDKEPPICDRCNTQITVEHILSVCSKYDNERLQVHFPPLYEDIFANNNCQKI